MVVDPDMKCLIRGFGMRGGVSGGVRGRSDLVTYCENCNSGNAIAKPNLLLTERNYNPEPDVGVVKPRERARWRRTCLIESASQRVEVPGGCRGFNVYYVSHQHPVTPVSVVGPCMARASPVGFLDGNFVASADSQLLTIAK
ncbi:uncharacterized protein CLUP02_07025 [Colletotrichum lupini]|uniref:Uncharacterized protein n=1 Tax=Colletotrichum lupini TaxID=145971 RepID=A0A9Q8SQ78_9PEZI|nr:uncharacterized protein CLUP02_07025 [Colletotrichum lupini]UQC81539.1 hypothetical protein CLUP02_07025 [Colletotrichum lupini]